MTGKPAQGSLKQQYPSEPWRWRADWNEGLIRDTSVSSLGCMWAFAIVWTALTVPFAARLPALWVSNRSFASIVAVFSLFAVFLLAVSVWQTVRARKYGVTTFRPARVPIPVGAIFQGEVETRLKGPPPAGCVARLLCTRKTKVGVGRDSQTQEVVLFHDEQVVRHGWIPGTSGLRVPIRFGIPLDSLETDERNSRDTVTWSLEVDAEVPGIDFSAQFDLPVFTREEGEQLPRLSAAARDAAWQPGRGIELHGEEIVLRNAQSGADRFGMLFITMIWFGAIVLFRQLGASWLVLAPVGVLGVIFLLAFADFLFGRTRLHADRSGLTVQRTWLGRGKERKAPASEIKELTVHHGSSFGSRMHLSLHATLTSGSTFRIARYIRTRYDADRLAERLLRRMGREKGEE